MDVDGWTSASLAGPPFRRWNLEPSKTASARVARPPGRDDDCGRASRVYPLHPVRSEGTLDVLVFCSRLVAGVHSRYEPLYAQEAEEGSFGAGFTSRLLPPRLLKKNRASYLQTVGHFVFRSS